ncbi:MAG: protein kinase family protein, partial [Pirellulaceae bacterium]
MSLDETDPHDRDAILARLLEEREMADDPETVLDRYCMRYPHLQQHLRQAADMGRMLGDLSTDGVGAVPERLGDFRLVRRIPGGGMGEVYDALQEPLNRRVAVKIVKREKLSAEARWRFLREQRVLAALHQTHIVPVFAAGEQDGLQYFAMPYIPGASLSGVVTYAQRHVLQKGGSSPSVNELAEMLSRQCETDVPPETLESSTPEAPRGRMDRGENRSNGKRTHLSLKYFRIDFSPDGATLASCGRDDVRLWDVASGRLLLDIKGGNTLHGVAFSPDGNRLAFGGPPIHWSGGAGVLRLEYGRGIRTLRGLTGLVSRVRFSANGELLAALSTDWRLGIWNAKNGELKLLVKLWEGYFTDNADFAFSPDGSRLAFSSKDRVAMWSINSGKLERTWELPPGLCDCIGFHPDGRLLLCRVETRGGELGPLA